MSDTQVFDVPMELGLELVTVIGPDFTNAERELVDDVIDKVDRVSLRMFFVDLQCPYPRCIINRRILEAAYLLALLSDKSQELDIHLEEPVCCSAWCGPCEGGFRAAADLGHCV